MDHHWLLTWSTYGTWVPRSGGGGGGGGRDPAGGEPRESGNGDPLPPRPDPRERAAAARYMLAEPPARFDGRDAGIVVADFRQTAAIRRWRIYAGAVTAEQVHLVVGVGEDPPASSLLRDFKSYASRALNLDRGYRRRWWTRSGSTRPLRTEGHLAAAVDWVRGRPDALARIEDTGDPPAPADTPRNADRADVRIDAGASRHG